MTTLSNSVPFGVTATDPFGIENDWDFSLVNYTESESLSTIAADGKRGEYSPDSQKSINGKVNISATFQSDTIEEDAFDDLSLSVGDAEEIAIDSITVKAQAGQHLQLEIAAHRHLGGSRTTHNKSQRDIYFPVMSGFGAQNFGLDIGVPEEALQSATWQVACGHTDDKDKDGNFLCGTTHGVMITATFEAIDPTTWTIPTGWVLQERSPSKNGSFEGPGTQSSTTHQSRKLTIVKYLGEAATDYSSAVVRTTHHISPRPANHTTKQIAVDASDLTAFASTAGTAGTAQTFVAEAANLAEALAVTAPTGYEVSADGTTYSASLSLAQDVAGDVQATVYIRLAASNSTAGTVSGNVTLSSTGATSVTVAVTGTVSAAQAGT